MVVGFRNLHYKEVVESNIEEENDFTLEPILECIGERLRVSFKAGVERLYVVKDLSSFVEQYEDKDVIQFGTKTEIDMARYRFNEKSKPLYEYVKGVVTQEQIRNEYKQSYPGYYYDNEQIKNQISLYGRNSLCKTRRKTTAAL